jgi:hypothetical protein
LYRALFESAQPSSGVVALFTPKEHTMTKPVTSHARWIGNAVLSGLVAAGAIWATHAISNSDAQTAAPPAPLPVAPAAAPVSNAPRLTAQQLDALAAPIALYPDALLAQVLMATTFPDDLAAAAAWSKQNPKLTGDDAVRAVSSTAWDPSVQSLVAFPQALATMAQNPNWVSSIGQAFLAQPNDVMDSVQRLRNAAYKAGNLSTSSQQKVVVQPAATTTTSTIVIEPANPQVVYVPTYNPTVVYGPWPYPTYPPVYMPPPPGYVVGTALVSGLAFGVGIAITNSLWGGCDWGRNDVNVNVNRYNNINVNNRIDASRTTANWDRSTAAVNRNRNGANTNRLQGATANRNAGGLANAAGGANADRSAFRGRDDAQRDQARNALSQRTGQNLNSPATDRVQNIRQGGNTNEGLARNTRAGGQGTPNRDVGNRAQDVNRDNALRDAGNGNASRQNVERGQQSRNAAASRAPQAASPRGGSPGANVTRPAGGAPANGRARGAGGPGGGGGLGGGGGGGGLGAGGGHGGGGHGGLRR